MFKTAILAAALTLTSPIERHIQFIEDSLPPGTAYYLRDETGALYLFDYRGKCIEGAFAAKLIINQPHPYAGEYDGCYAVDASGEAAFVLWDDGDRGIVLLDRLRKPKQRPSA